ncbi:hypothetical protein Tco_0809517 [Tanacetum coccineum]
MTFRVFPNRLGWDNGARRENATYGVVLVPSSRVFAKSPPQNVPGVTLEGISLTIPGNEKRYETDQVLNVFLDFDAKDAKGRGFSAELNFKHNAIFVNALPAPLWTTTYTKVLSRPDSLQNLCGSSRRPKQSQNIIGILRAHDGCATPSATSDLPAYNDLGDWKNSFRDHGQQNQPIYRNHFKATLTDGTADGQFFMPAVDEVIGCTCSELAQRYKQVHPHQTLSLSAEVNRTPVIHYHIHLGDVPKVPVLYKMTTEGNDDPSAGNSSGKPTCTFVIGALSYGPRKRIRNPALIENDIHASKSTLSKRQHVYTSTHVDCTGTLSYRPRKRTRNLAFIRNENGANGSTSSKRPHVCIDDGSQNPSPVMYTPTVAGSSSGTPGNTSPTHVDYTDHAFCLLIRRLRQKEVKIRALENYEKEKRRDRGER